MFIGKPLIFESRKVNPTAPSAAHRSPSTHWSLRRAAVAAALLCAPLAPTAAQELAPAVEPEIQAPAQLGSPEMTRTPELVPTILAPTEPQAAQAPAAGPDLQEPAEPPAEPEFGIAAVDEDMTTTLPRNLSPWGMFLAADEVVKGVMIGLAFASLVTWTIGMAKALQLWWTRRRLARGLMVVLGARTLDDAVRALADRSGSSALMVRTTAQELDASEATFDPAGVQARVASHLGRIEAGAARRAAAGTGLLATIGSTAPFVGLFGTVWGIMNSFIGISEAQTTNLAVVAPGIAEALLATALGLVAAIPAVVIYNLFARATAGYRARLADTAAAVERLVSRDLDRRRAPLAQAAE